MLAVACAPAVAPPLERIPPPTLHEDFYLAAAGRGEAVYRLEMGPSMAVMHVYREGRLARFGHDHVIAAREIYGFALLEGGSRRGRADLYVALDALSVDEPALRAQAGLATSPSASDIEGTRRNMLYKVFDARRHPYVTVRVRPEETKTEARLTTGVSLNGITRMLQTPIEIDAAGPWMRVLGEFSLNQTDFDLSPYSVLGGALRVADRVDLRFELHGRRVGAAGSLNPVDNRNDKS